jgi:hypothetical protein
LQSICIHQSKRRRLVAHAIRNARAHILGDRDNFGMWSVGDDAITGLEFSDTGPNLQKDSGVGVADGSELVKFGFYRLQSGCQAAGADFFQHDADLVGLLAGFVNPTGLTEVDQHSFGARGDEGGGAADEKLAWAGPAGGYLGHYGSAVAETLKDLKHWSSPRFKGRDLANSLDGPMIPFQGIA